MGVDDVSSAASAAGFQGREVAGVRLSVLVAFAALYMVWGSTFLAIRYAVETIPPFVLAWSTGGSAPPTGRATIALLAGFAGVPMLVASEGEAGGLRVGWALLLLFTAFSWAAGTVSTRHLAQPSSPLVAAAAPLLVAGVILCVISVTSGEATSFHPSTVSTRSLGGLAYLVVFGTVCTFSAYVWLLRQVPSARVATYAFVNPVVAVFLGWAIASEPVSAGTIDAAVIIVVAVAVAVSERRRMPSEAARDQSVRASQA